jgi:hypothetical protein
MALDSLEAFQGNIIIHVGEFNGDTGTRKFESHLYNLFNLETLISLPNWSNTCYSLSIWKRKSQINKKVKDLFNFKKYQMNLDNLYPLSCSVCSKSIQNSKLFY